MADTEPLPDEPTKDRPRATATRIVNLLNDATAEILIGKLNDEYYLDASGQRDGDGYVLTVTGRGPKHVLQGIAAVLDKSDPTGEAGGRPASWLAALAGRTTVSEERHAALDLDGKRGVVQHALTLHRDGISADDLRAMLEALEGQGMPGTASVTVDHMAGTSRTRVNARWSVQP